MSPKVPVIVGPTAAGKTALSLQLADLLNCQIISADSRQIYKYMNIGTAKVETEIQKRIPHHFIDIRDPDSYYSAGMYSKEARIKIDEIQQQNILPVIVGGSGLYIRALVDGIVELNAKDKEVRSELDKELDISGLAALYSELQKIDPAYASKISQNDPQRILRALEVFRVTNIPFSEWQAQKPVSAAIEPFFIGVTSPREVLYQRINNRVDQMFENGLIDEVRELENRGFSRNLNALNTVGYKEVFAHLSEEITYGEMVELIKRNTRRYSKRQMTWFNSDERIQWFTISAANELTKIARQIRQSII